ncbi:Indigoidine synthase A-like protein [Mycena sanguinolenta]|uniref:Indigoidine synthase A-like protein n=1 Tax=Mycena sanguinolenta TaxID=230812 RepID=A0A8H7CKH8_9AGAR|nr:Indigoidine synthase A-like protein [Mycena sanguinolenta]
MYGLARRVIVRAHSVRFASRLSLSESLARDAPIDVHPEVQDALTTGVPVVALETALTTHGLPPPINLQVTKDLETVVRSTGCIPATIGIVAGRVKIGLENSDLERLADVARNPRSVKISRRDIAPALASKADGGTTICATLIFAALANIKVFATGGLGGVHRGGENSMDVSADLHELTRCPVGLVSAGVKSILDIGRTLEYLETLGVPVISYSRTKDFPAFFSPRSGFQTPWNTDDPVTAARMLHSQWQLGLDNGALIAVPIPEEYAEKGEIIQQAVNQAVLESEQNGMSKRGKDVTPWLLSRVAELTKRDSIDSNIALLKHTALIGGKIAAQYQSLASQTDCPPGKTYRATKPIEIEQNNSSSAVPVKVMVVGCAAVDISAQSNDAAGTGLHSTSPGIVTVGLGGVGRNIAEACHRMGTPALLVAGLGKDPWGQLLRDETTAIGMRTDGFIDLNERTAVCNLFLDNLGDLQHGIADMGISQKLKADLVLQQISQNNPEIVALDGNLSSETIQQIVDACVQRNIQGSEPTSITKSERILPALEQCVKAECDTPVSFFTPNLLELRHVHDKVRADGGLATSPFWWSTIDGLSLGEAFRMDMAQLARRRVYDSDEMTGTDTTLAFLVEEGVAQMAITLTPFFRHIFIKLGSKGVVGVLRLSAKEAQSSGWAHERSNPGRRYVVAHGTSGTILARVTLFGPTLTVAIFSALLSASAPESNFRLPHRLEIKSFCCSEAATEMDRGRANNYPNAIWPKTTLAWAYVSHPRIAAPRSMAFKIGRFFKNGAILRAAAVAPSMTEPLSRGGNGEVMITLHGLDANITFAETFQDIHIPSTADPGMSTERFNLRCSGTMADE